MKVQNPQRKPLQEVMQQLSGKYPGAVIKKPFLTPNTIIAPKDNFKFLVRDKKTFFTIDFIPPVLWVIGAIVLAAVLVSVIMSLFAGQFVIGIGGALWFILALVIVKAIFKSRNRQAFETFQADVSDAVNRNEASSIF